MTQSIYFDESIFESSVCRRFSHFKTHIVFVCIQRQCFKENVYLVILGLYRLLVAIKKPFT